jgi:hypothetical protein
MFHFPSSTAVFATLQICVETILLYSYRETEFNSQWRRDFSFPVVHTELGVHASYYPMGYRGSFLLEINWPEREADNRSPSSAEDKNDWNFTSIPSYVVSNCR